MAKISGARWKQLKGKARERWGRITDNEMDVINGEMDQLIGKIEEKYQVRREDAEKEVRKCYKEHFGRSGQKGRQGRKKESLFRDLQKL